VCVVLSCLCCCFCCVVLVWFGLKIGYFVCVLVVLIAHEEVQRCVKKEESSIFNVRLKFLHSVLFRLVGNPARKRIPNVEIEFGTSGFEKRG